MSELTKKQLTEAQKLGHDHGCLIEMDCTQEHGDAFSLTTESLALLIATIRTPATNDALERAAVLLDNANTAMFDMYAGEIREMKVPT